MLDGTDVLYLVRRTPNTPLASNIRVGSRLPAHATTMGRMILAFMPPIEIERLYAGKELRALQRPHLDDARGAASRQRAQDRDAGIAWSDAHFERGIGSAAVAVFDFAGTPLGAINVSGPVGAFAGEGAPRVDRREAARRRRRRSPAVSAGSAPMRAEVQLRCALARPG